MRKFSDEEREEIREKLIETGRELLLTFGPDKTTVKDITEPVGIAKPTFYQFFDAKADLYIEIYDREFDDFIETIDATLNGIDAPQEKLERTFECYVAFGENNALVQQVFLERDYRNLADVSSKKREEVERKQISALVTPIREVQEQSEGPISEMDPLMVIGLIGSSLGFLILHKDEIDNYEGVTGTDDDGFYAHIRDTLITLLARGLVIDP
jgi:AcrR family transcriptional regulator